MKKKLAKIAALAMAAVSLVLVTVFVTVAFLTSTSSVSNVFTVGDVAIQMYESSVNSEGKAIADTDKNGTMKDSSENTYRLIPGKTYDKDPTIYITDGSEPSYLFVKITNQIAAIEAGGGTTIAAQMSAKGWDLVEGTTDVYYYADADGKPIKKNSGSVDVFTTFTIANNKDVSEYAGKKVDLTAYAIQADGFAETAEGAKAAWSALDTEYNKTNTQ